LSLVIGHITDIVTITNTHIITMDTHSIITDTTEDTTMTINWPNFTFPSINLWSKPYIDVFDSISSATRMWGKSVVVSFNTYDSMEQFLKLYDKRNQN